MFELDVFSLTLYVEGYLWYSSVIHPASSVGIVPRPIIHGYALTLALAGVDVDKSYVIVPEKYEYPGARKLLEKYGIYAYPAIGTRMFIDEFLFSMTPSDLLLYKPRSRYSLPIQVRITAFTPGTIFRGYVLAEPETFDDKEEFVVRLGVKRFGTCRAVLRRLDAEIAGPGSVTHPFNRRDAPGNTRVTRTIMHHPAGDVVYGYCGETIQAGGARLCLPRVA